LQLEERLGAEGVAHLGTADGELGDAVRELVADVAVAGVDDRPVGAGPDDAGRVLARNIHGRLHSWSDHSYESRTVARPVTTAPTGSRAGRVASLGPSPPSLATCAPCSPCLRRACLPTTATGPTR